MTNLEAVTTAATRALNRNLTPTEARLLALTVLILDVDPDATWAKPTQHATEP